MRWSTPVAYVFQNIESLDGRSLQRTRAGDRRTSALHNSAHVCEENGCDRPQLRRRRAPIRAHAQGSRYVVVVTKIVSSFRRGFIDASTSRRGAAFDGVEIEWISGASERATEPPGVCEWGPI